MAININRQHICAIFTEYTDRYNSKDTKIKLKIDHTFRVAAISDEIARNLELSKEDIDIAWMIGMLHDVGRFEQVRRYDTFSDADSIDHAQFGADLLFGENLIDSYLGSSRQQAILDGIIDEDTLDTIEIAIRNHSAYRIEEGLSDRLNMFCNIIRDADKIDILRVNTELPIVEIYNTTEEKLKNSDITPEVLEAFYEEHAVLRKLKKQPVDHIVGHISLCYELVYPISYEILRRQGWIYKLLAFESLNNNTQEEFRIIESHMKEFLEKKAKEL